MPKNKGKGGKTRKRGKNQGDADGENKREVTMKEEGQEYALVVSMLGNGRIEAYCYDGVKRQCHIRGKMRKKVWINRGDLILLSLRDFQDDKADVIHKYSPEEQRYLKKIGELPQNAKIDEMMAEGVDTGAGIEIGEDDNSVQVSFEDL